MAGGDHVATCVGAGCTYSYKGNGRAIKRSARARRGNIGWKSIAGESLGFRDDVSTTGKDAHARSVES